jgi:hypothetical protein
VQARGGWLDGQDTSSAVARAPHGLSRSAGRSCSGSGPERSAGLLAAVRVFTTRVRVGVVAGVAAGDDVGVFSGLLRCGGHRETCLLLRRSTGG